MSNVRRCRDDERGAILAIVNAAAQVYRSVIPADRWHEPYMPSAELFSRLAPAAAGLTFFEQMHRHIHQRRTQHARALWIIAARRILKSLSEE
jgi:hypothetical protein